jgi:hypothetical protein
MIDTNKLEELEQLTPERARVRLAEEKLKLQNIMTHLEMLESRLVQQATASMPHVSKTKNPAD